MSVLKDIKTVTKVCKLIFRKRISKFITNNNNNNNNNTNIMYYCSKTWDKDKGLTRNLKI